MASWMIHLRIADKLLDRIPGLSPIEFIMGNLAPDSGVPVGDNYEFSPSVKVSHFRRDDGTGKKDIDLERYRSQYFSPALRAGYTAQQDSFYLGYYTHLLTDCLWSDNISNPLRLKYADEIAADRLGIWDRIRKDWYDLDRLYLKKHPGFRAFRAYLGSVGFVNTYMDIFAPDAFDNRRAYITSFYLEERDDLDREYIYISEEQADRFVEESVEAMMEVLK